MVSIPEVLRLTKPTERNRYAPHDYYPVGLRECMSSGDTVAGRYPEHRISETTVHRVLSSPRRATALRLLSHEGTMSVSRLADAVAAAEAGCDQPPSPLRESVYNSLRQTHVPRLAELGLVAYDADNREVRALAAARSVRHYATPVALFGISWTGLYRGIGIVGLCLVVGTLAGLPVVSLLDPLLWASAALALLAGTSLCHLLADRRNLRSITDPGGE
jgi:hypothetical protein